MKGAGKRPLLRPGAGRWEGRTEREGEREGRSASRRAPASPRSGRPSAAAGSVPAPPGHRCGRREAGGEGGSAAAESGSERDSLCSARWLPGREPRSPPASPLRLRPSLTAIPAVRPARPGPARPPLPSPAQAASPTHKAPLRAAHCSALTHRPTITLSSAGQRPGPGGAAAQGEGSLCSGTGNSLCPRTVKHAGKKQNQKPPDIRESVQAAFPVEQQCSGLSWMRCEDRSEAVNRG
ncbi:uncharacterized protein LOC113946059 [Corapipo altera]|uniref:uncharacterized protein LOC113946059 n=1 Tax=Corapipo altera TaxID=415028 RepID=UPI000FD62FE5|nr:uncharacterized protein LOC113946059 [Corapipo altera]